ncbi:MAG: 3-hydroxyacyl-ACP dehydratase FabZ [Desulfovibrio sp.]|nr:3-hydroxyacyl-ACP dehydratase FabZ [Desulfovibrio sp.]
MTQIPATPFGTNEIMQMLPHRYPFLLVDRVVECVPNSHIQAYKNVTINEPFFQGHFPGMPIMPGVLILEALAQTGGILGACLMPDKLFLFRGVDGAKFRRQVVPGDRLDLFCDDMRIKLGVCKMHAKASVDGKIACEAEISAAFAERPR